MPLCLHPSGLTRSIAFDLKRPGRMVSGSALVCGFVPMRGTTAHTERCLPLTEDALLHLDFADVDDEKALSQALTYPVREHWMGITIGDYEPVEHLDLWLATTTSRFARLSAGTAARERALVSPALRWSGATLYDGGTLAYLALRPRGSESAELGIMAYGPDSDTFLAQTASLLHRWNRERPTQPVMTAYPADTPDDHLSPGVHLTRPNTRLTIAW